MARVDPSSKYPAAEKRPRSLFERTRSEELGDEESQSEEKQDVEKNANWKGDGNLSSSSVASGTGEKLTESDMAGAWNTLLSIISESPSDTQQDVAPHRKGDGNLLPSSMDPNGNRESDDMAEDSPSVEEQDVENDPDWREDKSSSSSSDLSGAEDTNKKLARSDTAGKKQTKKQLKMSGKKRTKKTRHVRKMKVPESKKDIKTPETTTCKERDVEASDMKSRKKASMHKEAKRTKKTVNQKYKCTLCKKDFAYFHRLKIHMENHEKDRANQTKFGVHECGNCSARYDNLYKYRVHRHHFCSFSECNEETDDKMEKSFICKKCGEIFKSKNDLTSHLWKQHNIKKKETPYFTCHKSFTDSRSLTDHDILAHSNKRKPTLKCNICAKVFNTLSLLQCHKRRHAPQIRKKCEQCSMIFTNMKSLERHKNRNHTFKLCEWCGRYFKKRSFYSKRHTCRNIQKKASDVKIAKNIDVSDGQDGDVKRESHKHFFDGTDDLKLLDTIEENEVESAVDQILEETTQELESKDVLQQMYQCTKCSLPFEVKSDFESHNVICQEGDKEAEKRKKKTKSVQKEAKKRKKEERPARYEIVTCEICQVVCESSVLLCLHELKEHRWVKCDFCEEEVPDDITLQMHKMLECPEKYKEVGTVNAEGESKSEIQTLECEGVGQCDFGGRVKKKTALKREKAKFRCKIRACHLRFEPGFEDQDSFQLHMSIHYSYNGECNLSDPRLLVIDKQDEENHGAEDTYCSNCKTNFSSKEAAKKHKSTVELVSMLYPRNCPLCEGEEYEGVAYSECELLQHNKLFKFKCQFCSQHFPDQTGYLHHLKFSHDLEDKKRCTGCNQLFGSQALQQHMNMSNAMLEKFECKCLSCGTVFDDVNKLDEHDEEHRTYICRICSRHFMAPDAFKHHKKVVHNTHPNVNAIKHYQCKHCRQSFAKMSELSAHVKQVMLEGHKAGVMPCAWENKLATCFGCGMSFQNQSDLYMHKAVWRYQCDFCHRHFRKRSDFLVHLRDDPHLQKLDLKCKYCKELFLNEFLKRNHDETNAIYKTTSHTCEKCGKEMQAACQLSRHKKKCKNRRIKQSRQRKIKKSIEYYHTKKQEINLRKLIGEICIICRGRLPIGCDHEKEEHLRQHNANSELTCAFCAESFESVFCFDFTRHSNSLKLVDTMCTVCKSHLTASCQVPAHIKSCIRGKICGFCQMEIKSDTSYHQQYKTYSSVDAEGELVGYQCTSCDMFVEAHCIKTRHEALYRYVCLKCNRHFQSFEDLVSHLTYSASMWETYISSGGKVFVCSYCREVVETEEQKCEHDALFVFRCQQCKLHFNSAAEMVYHFRYGHQDCYECDISLVSFYNVLQFYLENSSCERLQTNQVVSKRGGVKHQIGEQCFYVYHKGVLPTASLVTPQSIQQRILRSEGKIIYTCRRCNITTFYKNDKHECLVCRHCLKRFYGQNAGRDKEQHELSCVPNRFINTDESLSQMKVGVAESDSTAIDSADQDLDFHNYAKVIARDMFMNVVEIESGVKGTCPKKDEVKDVKIVTKKIVKDQNCTLKKNKVNIDKTKDACAGNNVKGHEETGNLKVHKDRGNVKCYGDTGSDFNGYKDTENGVKDHKDKENDVKCHKSIDKFMCTVEDKETQDCMEGKRANDGCIEENNEARNELVQDGVEYTTSLMKNEEKELITRKNIAPGNEDNKDTLTNKEIIEHSDIAMIGKRLRKKIVRFNPEHVPNIKRIALNKKAKIMKSKVTANIKRIGLNKKAKIMKSKVTVYACSCSKEFKDYGDYKCHWKENCFKNIRCVCTQCDEEFDMACQAAHHDRKQYSRKCRYCKMHFDQSDKLEEHKQNCSKCSFCTDVRFRDMEQKEHHGAYHWVKWIERRGNMDDVIIVARDPSIANDGQTSDLSTVGTVKDDESSVNQRELPITDQLTSNKEDVAPTKTSHVNAVSHEDNISTAPISKPDSYFHKSDLSSAGGSSIAASVHIDTPVDASTESSLATDVPPKAVPSDSDEDDDMSGIEINWGDPQSTVSIPKHNLGDVEITFEGRRLPFIVDASEARAVILTLLNDNLQQADTATAAQGKDSCDGSGPLGKPGTKKHDKKWMYVNIPKNLVATSSLRYLRCIIVPNSLPGLDQGATVTLSCVSLLPATADGMVTIFVPAVRKDLVTADKVLPVSGIYNTDSCIGNIEGSHDEPTSVNITQTKLIYPLDCYDVQQCVRTISENGQNILVFRVPEKCVGTLTPFIELYHRTQKQVFFSVVFTSQVSQCDDSGLGKAKTSLKVPIGQRNIDSIVKQENLCGQLTLSVVLGQ